MTLLVPYIPQTEQKCRITVRVCNWEHDISNEDWRYEIFYLDWLEEGSKMAKNNWCNSGGESCMPEILTQ